MGNKPPLIAVTGPSTRLKFGWWATRLMLALAGSRAQYVTANSQHLPSSVGGVIIGGGDDIEPMHYGLNDEGKSYYDPQRDAMEMRVVRAALENNIPTLGICRGAQLINVVSGGTLYADIRPLRQQTPNKSSIFPIKSVTLKKESNLHNIYGCEKFRINSLHRQAIKNIGNGLIPSAHDEDTFIQAIESTFEDKTILGVQWHPEYMPYSCAQRRLFKAFTAKVKNSTNTLDLNEVLRRD